MVDCSLCIHGGHVQGGSLDGQQIFCKKIPIIDNIISSCGCLTFTATYIDFIARSTWMIHLSSDIKSTTVKGSLNFRP